MTMAPLVVDGQSLRRQLGRRDGRARAGSPRSTSNTGKELWRAYSTGPDSMVRIGADFKPFYSWMQGKDLGVTTWPANAWKHGAGAVWGWVTYDPGPQPRSTTARATPVRGTPRSAPAQPVDERRVRAQCGRRDGEVGVLSSRRTTSGTTTASTRTSSSTSPINGQTRKVMVQFNRNGFAYTIDRTTGEVLVAKPFGHENWATGHRPEDGDADRRTRRSTPCRRAAGCATSARPTSASRTGSRRRSRRARACSTCRFRTSAWTTRDAR